MSKKNPEKNEQVIARRYRVQFDITYTGTPGSNASGPSEAVPDMNLTVRQLLENHVRGRDSKVAVRNPLYFETEIPTLRDITDVERFRKQLQERMKEVDDFIKTEKKAKKEAEKKAKEPIPPDPPKSEEK